MKFERVPLLLAFTHLASSKQPSAPSSIAAPLRELPWGTINFLHTTDTHGWHGGHLQEAQYSADWGDYISFAHHLRNRAAADGSDLLLIDTGDRVEGNGLYDASEPPGKYTFDIFKQQHIDIVTSGNHELYINTTSRREYDEVVPDLKESYLASNVDIYDPRSGEYVPFAARFRKFETQNQGISILAFGFLFDFRGNANNTLVHSVSDTVEEQWFQDAIREEDIDLFVVAGHVPVRDSQEFDTIYKAIRDVKWDIPIVFFGGHTHIRDYRKWERKACGIESGRYMETIGFLSISGVGGGSEKKKDDDDDTDVVEALKKSPKYERLYIDNNLFSLHHHTNTTVSNFDTPLGLNISRSIRSARAKLNLDETFGCAPHDFWLNRAPYPSNNSLLTWLEEHVLPDTFTTANSSAHPSIVITNSGALRFDIFGGPFTTDTTFLLSPFLSGFRMITNVPFEAAGKVLGVLNNEGPVPLRDLLGFAGGGEEGWGEWRLEELVGPLPPVPRWKLVKGGGGVDGGVGEGFVGLEQDGQVPLTAFKEDGGDDEDEDEPQVPGYTTSDDAGDDGDDTIHQPIKFYDVPNCVGANIGFSAEDKDGDKKPESVDLIFNEFIQDWILLALRYLGVNYGEENTRPALEGRSMTSVIKEWVGENWECEDE